MCEHVMFHLMGMQHNGAVFEQPPLGTQETILEPEHNTLIA